MHPHGLAPKRPEPIVVTTSVTFQLARHPATNRELKTHTGLLFANGAVIYPRSAAKTNAEGRSPTAMAPVARTIFLAA